MVSYMYMNALLEAILLVGRQGVLLFILLGSKIVLAFISKTILMYHYENNPAQKGIKQNNLPV